MNYVTMCKTAEEVQKLWEPVVGDKFVLKNDESEKIYTVINVKQIPKDDLIWLPYQEELQNLVESKFQTKMLMLESFLAFLYRGHGDVNSKMSLNELMLAFLMKILFNKIMIKEDWVSDLKQDLEFNKS